MGFDQCGKVVVKLLQKCEFSGTPKRSWKIALWFFPCAHLGFQVGRIGYKQHALCTIFVGICPYHKFLWQNGSTWLAKKLN